MTFNRKLLTLSFALAGGLWAQKAVPNKSYPFPKLPHGLKDVEKKGAEGFDPWAPLEGERFTTQLSTMPFCSDDVVELVSKYLNKRRAISEKSKNPKADSIKLGRHEVALLKKTKDLGLKYGISVLSSIDSIYTGAGQIDFRIPAFQKRKVSGEKTDENSEVLVRVRENPSAKEGEPAYLISLVKKSWHPVKHGVTESESPICTEIAEGGFRLKEYRNLASDK